MTKQTKTLLTVGALAAVAYYLMKQNSGSAATPQEVAQSAASTLSADLASTLGVS